MLYLLVEEELEGELKKLELMEANTPEVLKKLDQEFWILVGLKKMYQMCKDVNQLEIIDYTKCDYVPVRRAVKSKVTVHNFVLRKYDIPYVMFSGLFLVVEGYSIHRDVMENFFNDLVSNRRIATLGESKKPTVIKRRSAFLFE